MKYQNNNKKRTYGRHAKLPTTKYQNNNKKGTYRRHAKLSNNNFLSSVDSVYDSSKADFEGDLISPPPKMPAVDQDCASTFGDFSPNDVAQRASGAWKCVVPNYVVNREEKARKRNHNNHNYNCNNNNLVKPCKTKRKNRIGLYAALIILVVLLAGGGVTGFLLYSSAKSMQSQVGTIMADVSNIQNSIKSGDYATAQSSAHKVKDQADKLCKELSSPLWSAATLIPVYGQDVKSIVTAASVLQDASENALVPITDALVQTPPSSLFSSDGTIDIASVEVLLGSLQSAAPVMQRCAEQMDALPEMHIDQLSSAITKATDKLNSINDVFQQVNTFAPMISTILGDNGQRTYLIAAQNSAEIRSCGGFPGSCGTLTINNGKISLGDFESVWKVMDTSLPDGIILTDEELSIFDPLYIKKPCDEEFNPDFPRVAEIWAASYSQTTGVQIDGVVSMTPSIIQSLLNVVGEIILSDGTIVNGSNATKVLQHDIYWKYLSGKPDPGANDFADALFAETAELAFEKVLNNINSSTMTKLATTLVGNMSDRTLMVWMKDPNEQSKIVAAGCSGALGTDPSHPEVGVFVSNIIGSKLGWYLDMDTTVLKQSVNSDGSVTYQVQVKLFNTLTSEEADTGGSYIVGYSDVLGQMVNDLFLYAPAGGSMSEIYASNGAIFSTASYKGLPVSFTRTTLSPSESVLLTFTVTTAPCEQADLVVSSTPTLTEYR